MIARVRSENIRSPNALKIFIFTLSSREPASASLGNALQSRAASGVEFELRLQRRAGALQP
jgi:hypothetical protein